MSSKKIPPPVPTNKEQKQAAKKKGLISGFAVKLKRGKPKANHEADQFFGTGKSKDPPTAPQAQA